MAIVLKLKLPRPFVRCVKCNVGGEPVGFLRGRATFVVECVCTVPELELVLPGVGASVILPPEDQVEGHASPDVGDEAGR